jgi:hypothetical protein
MRSTLSGDDRFLRLVLRDEQLLRAEFDSLVASLRHPDPPRSAGSRRPGTPKS